MEIYLGQLQPGLKDCHYNGQLRKLFHKLAHKVRLLLGESLTFQWCFFVCDTRNENFKCERKCYFWSEIKMNFVSAFAAQNETHVKASPSFIELMPSASTDWNATVTLDLNVSVFSSSPRQTYQPTATFNSQTTPTVNTSATPTVNGSSRPPVTGRFSTNITHAYNWASVLPDEGPTL